MSSLGAVGTSSLHSSLKVPPMPLPAEQFLQPLLPCRAFCNHSQLREPGGRRHFRSQDKNFSHFSSHQSGRRHGPLCGEPGAGKPPRAFPVLCYVTGTTHFPLLQPRFGERTQRARQTCWQSRNFISLFRRKETADKSTETSFLLQDCSLQRASNTNKGY